MLLVLLMLATTVLGGLTSRVQLVDGQLAVLIDVHALKALCLVLEKVITCDFRMTAFSRADHLSGLTRLTRLTGAHALVAHPDLAFGLRRADMVGGVSRHGALLRRHVGGWHLGEGGSSGQQGRDSEESVFHDEGI